MVLNGGGKMKTLHEIIKYTDTLFRTNQLESYKVESGITCDSGKGVNKIAYCTNLTPESVEKAHKTGAELLITHHDAWDFVYGLKEKSLDLLEKYGISHYFTHLPLDDSEFGTNSSFISKLGLKEVSKHCNHEGYMCGVLGEYETPVTFEEFVAKVEEVLEEPCLAWKFNDKPIKKVYNICGAGPETFLMKEGIDLGADLYITGERVLYTVQYAQISKINLVIGSHTFTEIFGVESLVEKVVTQFNDLDYVKILEDHIETLPLGK